MATKIIYALNFMKKSLHLIVKLFIKIQSMCKIILMEYKLRL